MLLTIVVSQDAGLRTFGGQRCHPTATPARCNALLSPLIYLSNGNTRFQSSLMLITTQLCFFAMAYIA
jgi:hypothetical protein